MASAPAAGLAVDAQAGRLTGEVGERDIEHLDEDAAHVASDPLLEDVDEEAAPLLGRDRARGDEVARLRVQRSTLDVAAPARLGDLDELGGGALDDGDELDEARLHLIAEVAIDLAAAIAVDGVDGAEDVELGTGPREELARHA